MSTIWTNEKKFFQKKNTYSIVGCSDKLQDNHESNENRLTVFKAKSRVEGLELVQVCEESKHEEDVDLRDQNVLQDVIHLPVAQLMAQNSQNFCKKYNHHLNTKHVQYFNGGIIVVVVVVVVVVVEIFINN